MVKILVSACLLGTRCKWNSRSNENFQVIELSKLVEFVPVCPEVDSGLPTPRIPSEIVNGKVFNEAGLDVSSFFNKGAKIALNKAKKEKIKYALLKNGSPSCGSSLIYNGKFDRTKIPGSGITASLLKKNGILVYSEDTINELIDELKKKNLI